MASEENKENRENKRDIWKAVNDLTITLAEVKNDVKWIKGYLSPITFISLILALGAIFEIVLRLITH